MRLLVLPLLVGAVAAGQPARGAELVLRRVMLSSAGVGYYELEAEGEGIPGLDVKLDQVDDVLKSLVVFGGASGGAGGVGAVTLPGRDDRVGAFSQVPFDAGALESPVRLLNSLVGTEVVVEGPRPMRGRVLRAESVREPVAMAGAEGAVRTRVSLLTEGGLRQFVLEEADAVQVADPGLRERMARAVAAMRRAGAGESRRLTIAAGGAGVRVGYVAGAPLWKASYRLVLPGPGTGAGAGTARLQAWATLENASASDWHRVSLSLQYGNPVTFRQAIYRSYFVQRPEVPVEVLGRLLPDVDRRARVAAVPGAPAPPPPPPPSPAMVAGSLAAPKVARAEGMAELAPAEAAAAVEEGATETVFALPGPVDLPAGQSASVVIVDAELPAERVALAKPDEAHPLAALRLRNTTGSSLPAGVLTLYDPGAAAGYAGDARLGGLPAGESRLLPFAQDLRTGLEWKHEEAVTVAGLAAAGGVLAVEQRTRRISRVVATAPAGEGRTVLVEVAKDGARVADGFARPVEETAVAWRFALPLKAGETGTLSYALDTTEQQSVSLVDDDEALATVLNTQGVSPAARAALQRITALRGQEAARMAERDGVAAQRAAVEADETRLRANLQALQPGDALRTRLLRQLDADETRVGQLDGALEAANGAVDRAHRALLDAVGGLRL